MVNENLYSQIILNWARDGKLDLSGSQASFYTEVILKIVSDDDQHIETTKVSFDVWLYKDYMIHT